MKRENEQLSAAIQELNENVVRNTASQNPSIPKLTNHIKDLTEVIVLNIYKLTKMLSEILRVKILQFPN